MARTTMRGLDGNDTHASNVYILSVDAHIQIDRLGSEREYV